MEENAGWDRFPIAQAKPCRAAMEPHAVGGLHTVLAQGQWPGLAASSQARTRSTARGYRSVISDYFRVMRRDQRLARTRTSAGIG
jgi:hypothetical protein